EKLPIALMNFDTIFDHLAAVGLGHGPVGFVAVFQLGNHMPNDCLGRHRHVTITVDDLANDGMRHHFSFSLGAVTTSAVLTLGLELTAGDKPVVLGVVFAGQRLLNE